MQRPRYRSKCPLSARCRHQDYRFDGDFRNKVFEFNTGVPPAAIKGTASNGDRIDDRAGQAVFTSVSSGIE